MQIPHIQTVLTKHIKVAALGHKMWQINNCFFKLIYVSKCSASIQVPHIQTVLTKNIEVAALGHKMWQFINCFLQSYMLLIFLFT